MFRDAVILFHDNTALYIQQQLQPYPNWFGSQRKEYFFKQPKFYLLVTMFSFWLYNTDIYQELTTWPERLYRLALEGQGSNWKNWLELFNIIYWMSLVFLTVWAVLQHVFESISNNKDWQLWLKQLAPCNSKATISQTGINKLVLLSDKFEDYVKQV